MMIPRLLQKQVEDSLNRYPAVGLVGPRQAGKTTLAKAIGGRAKALYLDLELPSDFAKLDDPELYLSQYPDRLVIIDEVQRMPSLPPSEGPYRSRQNAGPLSPPGFGNT